MTKPSNSSSSITLFPSFFDENIKYHENEMKFNYILEKSLSYFIIKLENSVKILRCQWRTALKRKCQRLICLTRSNNSRSITLKTGRSRKFSLTGNNLKWFIGKWEKRINICSWVVLDLIDYFVISLNCNFPSPFVSNMCNCEKKGKNYKRKIVYRFSIVFLVEFRGRVLTMVSVYSINCASVTWVPCRRFKSVLINCFNSSASM